MPRVHHRCAADPGPYLDLLLHLVRSMSDPDLPVQQAHCLCLSLRAAKRLGIPTVAVFSEADRLSRVSGGAILSAEIAALACGAFFWRWAGGVALAAFIRRGLEGGEGAAHPCFACCCFLLPYHYTAACGHGG